MTGTPLDLAAAAMEAGGDADRLRFYERLADAELFVLLEDEPDGRQITPRVFDLEDGPFVLAFDREERLAECAGAAPYIALSGRRLAQTLTGEGLGLGLNLGVAPSSQLLPPEAFEWLAKMVANAPEALEARASEIGPPGALPEALLEGLDAKMATLVGLARSAYLAGAVYDGGRHGHLLAFVDAVPGAEAALAQAASEALIFSGIEAGEMDVTFLAASDPMAARLARVALRIALPAPPEPAAPVAPGSDPSRPPILR